MFIAVGLALTIISVEKGKKDTSIVSNTETPSVSPLSSPTPTSKPKSSSGQTYGKDIQSLTPEQVEQLVNGNGLSPSSVPYAELTKPATCSVAGEIKFLSDSLSQNLGAELTYTGIDSPARQIKWNVYPSEGLKVGPNLAAPLKLPDGKSQVIVSLPAAPAGKSYTLTSSMTYGRLVDGGVRVYEVACTGSIKVTLDY